MPAGDDDVPAPRPKPVPEDKAARRTHHDAEIKLAEPAVRLKPGARLQGTPYEIVRWLGDGGMGVVFEARHLDLDRRVALKILRADGGSRVEDLFRQEARVLAMLGTDYVVQVFDFFQLRDGRSVIAMELIDGLMLSELLDLPLGAVRGLPILRQVCKGLAIAHSEGIVHRDIKPPNVALVTRDGRPDGVKLLDFGVAQFMSGATTCRAGTPGYLAPEVIGGLPSDARADLYAVGSVAYLMFAGRPPFDSEDAEEVVAAHLADDPPPPSDFADVPRPLEEVIMRCLAKRPEDRFASAEDLEAALCEVQIAMGLHTPWDDLPLPDVEPQRRERLLREMPELAVPPRRSSLLPWVLSAAAVFAGAGVAAYALTRQPAVEAGAVEEVETIAHRARAAAARAFFVYPPPERPDEATAFSVVRELESRADLGSPAAEQAVALRSEFADTLQWLGDRYWEEEGGRPFAIDYYAQAVVFDPARADARQRAAMTPGELSVLRTKAQTGDFSQLELEAVEPLLVLAQPEDADAVARLDRIQDEDSDRAATTQARLRKLTKGASRRAKRRGAESDAPVREEERSLPAEPEPAPAAEQSQEPAAPAATPEPVTPGEAGQARDDAESARATARRLTKAGDTARRAGDFRRAEGQYAAALQADRRHAAAYAGLARVHYAAGHYSLAARSAKKAVRFAPRVSEHRILLGDAYYKSYDNAAARNQYQRAAELGHAKAAARLKKVNAHGD